LASDILILFLSFSAKIWIVAELLKHLH